MNKLLTLILVFVSTLTFAQKTKVFSAATSLSTGNIQEAKKYIDEALESVEVQEMAKAWMTKGEVYFNFQQNNLQLDLNVKDAVAEAEDAYRKAYELDKNDAKKPGKYLPEIMDGLYNTSIGYYEKGEKAYNEKQFGNATVNFNQAADLLNYLETSNLIKDDYKTEAIELRNNSYINAALCALNEENYANATVAYKALIKLGFGTEDAYANLAAIYLAEKKNDEVLAIVTEGLAKFPDNKSLEESKMNYYIVTNQSDKAIESLLNAVKESPKNADLYFNLAIAYDKLDQDDKMLEAYHKMLEINPEYYEAYLNLGAYYNDKANEVIKTMNEITDYKEANKMLPLRDEWYNKALPFLETAYKLRPEDPAVKRALGRIYANMNLLDKVKELDK